jgi:hypothetical protein
VANGFCWVPLPPEVNSFEGEVGRDESLVADSGIQNSAVIADGVNYTWPGGGPFGWGLGLAADSFDDFELVEWQVELNYREADDKREADGKKKSRASPVSTSNTRNSEQSTCFTKICGR